MQPVSMLPVLTQSVSNVQISIVAKLIPTSYMLKSHNRLSTLLYINLPYFCRAG